MKKTLFFLIVFLFSVSILSAGSVKEMKGKLNNNGYIQLNHSIEDKGSLSITGRVFYKNLWRPVPVFWNKQSIIIDIGPEYKGIPYVILIIRYE